MLGGVGISLALVGGLVELHGGTVEARSGGTGLGSEFTVRLPIGKGPVEAAQKPSDGERVMPRGARQRRILVVETIGMSPTASC
jgi:hypothetical protein